MPELLLEQGSKPLVEVGKCRVERDVDHQPHVPSQREMTLRISTLTTSCSDRGFTTRCYRSSRPLGHQYAVPRDIIATRPLSQSARSPSARINSWNRS